MTTAYVLFADGVGIGILARQRRGFVFHASGNVLAGLDGISFRRSRDARVAIYRRLQRSRITSQASGVQSHA